MAMTDDELITALNNFSQQILRGEQSEETERDAFILLVILLSRECGYQPGSDYPDQVQLH
jgi:hypothetical protein